MLAGLVQIFLITGNTAFLSLILMHIGKTSTNKQAYKQKTGDVKEAHLKRNICVILIKNQIELLIRKRMEV